MVNNKKLAALIFMAYVFWLISFRLQWFNFWIALPISVGILTILAWCMGGPLIQPKDLKFRELIWGLISASFLYLAFFIGNWLAGLLFDFAPSQVRSIYSIQTQGPLWFIVLILIFVTSPGEELFWRGFVQRNLMAKLGNIKGWLVSVLIYASIHISSLNFILVIAALVAGLVWGLLYLYRKTVTAVIISHIVWTVIIFVMAPIR